MSRYKVVITRYNGCVLFSYFDEKHPLEIMIFKDNGAQLNSVYVGRVQKVAKNIGAAFVTFFENNTTGFLKNCSYKEGDLLPVQIVKEKTKLKEAVLSESISLSGVYAVVHNNDCKLSVSSKLTENDRRELKKEFKKITEEIGYGVILRTNAHNVSSEIVRNEIMKLKSELDGILKYSDKRIMGSLLYTPVSEWLKAVSDIKKDCLDEIITDDKDIYEAVCKYIQDNFDEKTKQTIDIKLYQDNMVSLMTLFSLKSRLNEALNRIVWLKSGAFLVIEHTEALVSIDVNTGKIAKKKSLEETFLSVNLEACDEIAVQLRLRNLSGIIIIDFINLKNPENNRILMEHLREVLANDSIKTQVHDMTKLGLVEVTRMKGRQPLYEQARLISNDAKVSGDKGSV